MKQVFVISRNKESKITFITFFIVPQFLHERHHNTCYSTNTSYKKKNRIVNTGM